MVGIADPKPRHVDELGNVVALACMHGDGPRTRHDVLKLM